MDKILYDYQIVLMQKYGGISRYFYELIQRAQQNDFKLLFPVIGNQNFYFQDYFGKDIKMLHGKQRIRVIKWNQMATKYYLHRIGTQMVFHPTYYNPYFLDDFQGKLVVTVHDMIHENFPEYYGNNATIQHKKSLMDRADKIVAVSGTTKRDILTVYKDISEDKIDVIYHGNVKETSMIVSDVYSHKYSQGERFILYVGNRDRYKNFSTFALAMTNLLKEDDKLYLVCVGGGRLQPEERVVFENAKCENQVLQVDASEEELAWLYQNAACFVFPSKAEGFGIPILEAWKNRCPVILSDIDCFREIGGNAAMFFDPDNMWDMKNKIEKAVYGTERENLIKKGEERGKLFSWDKCAKKHFDIYRSLMAR